jgi:hypothetical protein
VAFDLDHLGPKTAQKQAGIGPGPHPTKIKDSDPLKREQAIHDLSLAFALITFSNVRYLNAFT